MLFPTWLQKVISTVLVVVQFSLLGLFVSACGSSNSVALAPQVAPESNPGATTLLTSENGVFRLPEATPGTVAGQIRVNVTSPEPLPASLTIQGVRFVKLPLTIVVGMVSYAAEVGSAFTALADIQEVTIEGVRQAGIRVERLAGGNQRHGRIFQGNLDEVTFVDFVLVYALTQLPVNQRTAENIATTANTVYPAGNVTAASLDPVPTEANTNFVVGPEPPAVGPDFRDAVVVYAATQLPANVRTAENLAVVANQLYAEGNIQPSQVIGIPGYDSQSELFITDIVTNPSPVADREVIVEAIILGEAREASLTYSDGIESHEITVSGRKTQGTSKWQFVIPASQNRVLSATVYSISAKSSSETSATVKSPQRFYSLVPEVGNLQILSSDPQKLTLFDSILNSQISVEKSAVEKVDIHIENSSTGTITDLSFDNRTENVLSSFEINHSYNLADIAIFKALANALVVREAANNILLESLKGALNYLGVAVSLVAIPPSAITTFYADLISPFPESELLCDQVGQIVPVTYTDFLGNSKTVNREISADPAGVGICGVPILNTGAVTRGCLAHDVCVQEVCGGLGLLDGPDGFLCNTIISSCGDEFLRAAPGFINAILRPTRRCQDNQPTPKPTPGKPIVKVLSYPETIDCKNTKYLAYSWEIPYCDEETAQARIYFTGCWGLITNFDTYIYSGDWIYGEKACKGMEIVPMQDYAEYGGLCISFEDSYYYCSLQIITDEITDPQTFRIKQVCPPGEVMDAIGFCCSDPSNYLPGGLGPICFN